jgi:murein L,D-transpeptidase YcbB/YkuD
MTKAFDGSRRSLITGGGAAAALWISGVGSARAQSVPLFKQAVAEGAARDEARAAFYKVNDYKGIWTGSTDRDTARRAALINAIEGAGAHGLPVDSYNLGRLENAMQNARSQRDLGFIEVEMSRLFLRYATDVQTGIIDPRRLGDPGLVLTVPYRDRTETLSGFVNSSPGAFLRKLPPQSSEYLRLMREKLRLEALLDSGGGWGPTVRAKSLKPGNTGESVVALRNRLISMGYMRRSAVASYDADLAKAVAAFQADNGMFADGVAGDGTVREINNDVEDRLASIHVAMERERWMNMPLGDRHVWVNIADFTAQIRDDEAVTFETRAVVGANDRDRRTPEFSDEMEMVVCNPTWNVPRSITVKEYLPLLQQNPMAASHLRITDRYGRLVDRTTTDFSQYTASNFPFDMKQPPSDGNALGLVKFLFPNRWNIYLHDTPAKSLFKREVRAFSHGCIRLMHPFDFAYTILSGQTNDPKGLFKSHLDTRRESVIQVEPHVPVHLTYRTAFTTAKGRMAYRRDIYGRDALIFETLASAGVVLRPVQG